MTHAWHSAAVRGRIASVHVGNTRHGTDMGVGLFLGCALVAFGPGGSLFALFVFPRPTLIIITLCSAFTWLLSVFASSLLWTVIPPLQEVHIVNAVLGALIQEAVRAAFVKGYAKIEARVAALSPGGATGLNDVSSAVSSGLGFGLMQAVILYGSLLGSSLQEATLYAQGCSEMSLYVLSSFSALFFSALQVLLMVLAFDAHRRSSRSMWATVVGVHVAAALATLLNTAPSGCVAVPPVLAAVVAFSVWRVRAVMLAYDYAGRKPPGSASFRRSGSQASARSAAADT